MHFHSNELHANKTFIRIQAVQHCLWILPASGPRTVIAWHISLIRDRPSKYFTL